MLACPAFPYYFCFIRWRNQSPIRIGGFKERFTGLSQFLLRLLIVRISTVRCQQNDISYEVFPEVSPKQGEIFPDWGDLACFGYGSTSILTSLLVIGHAELFIEDFLLNFLRRTGFLNIANASDEHANQLSKDPITNNP
jgi:hypothetical protein